MLQFRVILTITQMSWFSFGGEFVFEMLFLVLKLGGKNVNGGQSFHVAQ